MSVCINSSLNFTRTKYGHGEGPTLAHRTLPKPEPPGLSPLAVQPWEGTQGAALPEAGLPPGVGEGGGRGTCMQW